MSGTKWGRQGQARRLDDANGSYKRGFLNYRLTARALMALSERA